MLGSVTPQYGASRLDLKQQDKQFMGELLQNTISAMRKIDHWLIGANRYLALSIFLVLAYISQVFWYFVAASFYDLDQTMGGASSHGRNPLEMMILGCVIAPAIETLLLQYIPIRLCLMTKRVSLLGAIFISATLFGMLHGYSTGYMAAMFGVGIIFAYAFIVFDRRHERAGTSVFVLHAARNLISFVIWCCTTSR